MKKIIVSLFFLHITTITAFADELYDFVNKLNIHMNTNSIGTTIGGGWTFQGSAASKNTIELNYMGSNTMKELMNMYKNDKSIYIENMNFLKEKIKLMNIRQYCQVYDKYFNIGLVFRDKYMSRDKVHMFKYTITKDDCRLNR